MELPPVAEAQDAQSGDGGAAGVVAGHGTISGKVGTPRPVKTGEEEQEEEDGGGDGAGEGQQEGRGDGAEGETSDNSDSDPDSDKEAASKPVTAGKQNERETAEKLVHTCKMQLKKPEGPNATKIGEWEATMHMWDVWLDKFNTHSALWRDEDEAKGVIIAREIRRRGKEQGLPAKQVNEKVAEALNNLPMLYSVPDLPEIPVIEVEFSPELLSLRRMRVKAAERRMQQAVAAHSLKSKEEDEAAISRATLAAAKARVLGKPHRHVEMLRLPVEEFVVLKSGKSLRKGVSVGTGKVIEEMRQASFITHGDSKAAEPTRVTRADSMGRSASSVVARTGSFHSRTSSGHSGVSKGSGLSKGSAQMSGGGLTMSSRQVDDEWAMQIASALRKGNERCEIINLSSNLIGAEGCKWLSFGLSSSAYLTRLDLGNNMIDRVALDHLSDGLTANRSVTDLRLNSLKFGEYIPEPSPSLQKVDSVPVVWSKGLGKFPEYLAVALRLTRLDLGGNRMGAEMFGELTDALTLNKTVRWLDISGNHLGSDGGAHLGRLLATATGLQYVNASCNRLGVQGSEWMSAQMELNTSLTDLRLASNMCEAEGSIFIAQVIGFCQGLLSLDISCCGFDGAGAQELGSCIGAGGVTKLTTLQLGRNAIGDVGVMKLAASLGNHRGITDLDMSYCEISDVGAPAVGALCSSLPNLHKLKISFNRITEDGFSLFVKWLLVSGSRCKCSTIDVDGNLLGDEAAESISQLIRASPWIVAFGLRGNFFGRKGLKQLLEVVKECPQVRDMPLRGNDDIHREGGKREWDELNGILQERGRHRSHEQVFLGEKIKKTVVAKPPSGGSLGAMGAMVF